MKDKMNVHSKLIKDMKNKVTYGQKFIDWITGDQSKNEEIKA